MVPAIATMTYSVNDLHALEEGSEFIVKAKVLPSSINETFKAPNGLIFYGHTYTDIEITDVFSGNVRIGDTLTIIESYYYIDELTTRNIIYTANYGPSTVNQEYIFFLKEQSKPEYAGMYHVFGVDKGRYPVFSEKSSFGRTHSVIDVNAFTDKELNLGDENSTVYRKIFNEVIEKYY